MTTATAAIRLEAVSTVYEGERRPALREVTLTVDAGELVYVVGPNAAGKTTLLETINGLLPPATGTVQVHGMDVTTHGRHVRQAIGYVPQYPAFARDFPVTVEQVVLTGRLGRGRLLGGYRRDDRELARWVMTQTEIVDLAPRRIATLSGGQLQRVLVARALACEPQILILDEPTANIDMRVESDIFDLLRVLNQRMTILVVSHDVAFISAYVRRVACVNRTLLCHATESIDGQVIQDLYGGEVRHVAHVHPH